MDTVPYELPLGDRVVFEAEGRLEFSDAMCAAFAGGPTQTVAGRILVTAQRLVFRPIVGQPHPQMLELVRDPSWTIERVQRRWLGLVARGAPVVAVGLRVAHRAVSMVFHVPDPDALVVALRSPPAPSADPRALLAEALAAGVRERGRYTPTLAELSFPAGFWHTEAHEDLAEVVLARLRELGVELTGLDPELDPEAGLGAWLATLDLDVEPLTGPEDYESGPGSEAWARKDQIERICAAANARLTGPRRFHAFAEDVPGWEPDEPVWLLLDDDERRGLLDLGIVRIR